MRTLRIFNACLFALVLFAAYDGTQAAAVGAPGQGQAPAAAQGNPFGAPAQQPAPAQQATGSCGNLAFCVENDDLAAMVTSFRTSDQGGYKVIDVALRFLNKTNDQLVIGYAANSGIATDERGNRYIVWGQNGTRGIGTVYGNNFDARLSLRPAGFGDAQFELMWRPSGREVIGSSFVFDVTVDKISVDRNLMTLGGEYPLHFQGLADGVGGGGDASAAAPAAGQAGGGGGGEAMSTAVAGCNPSGTPTTASGAVASFSNLRSMFKRKGQVAQAAANGQSPCPAGSTPADASAGAAPATNAAPAAVPAMSATPGVSPAPAMRANTGAPATAAAPAMTASPNATPAPAMRANTVPGGRTPATANPNQPMMQPGNTTPQAGRAAFPATGAANQPARGMAATMQPARGQAQMPQAVAGRQPAGGRPANSPAALRPQTVNAAPQPARPAAPPAAAARPQLAAKPQPAARPQPVAAAKVPPKKPATTTTQTAK